MADASHRVELFRLIKSNHTTFRAARGKRTKSCRDKQVGYTKKEDKPSPAASGFPRGPLNAGLIRISEFLSSYIDGGYIIYHGFQVRCRGPPFLAFDFPNVQKRRSSATLIRIAKNGTESEWLQLVKKHHRTLLLEKLDAVFTHIDSLYPKSPKNGQVVELSFPCFSLLTREFVLKGNRQEKRNERHQDCRAMEDINLRENGALVTSLEEIYLRQEVKRTPYGPPNALTDLQQHRFRLFLDGYTLTRVGKIRGISHTVVRRSAISAIEKIKKHFG